MDPPLPCPLPAADSLALPRPGGGGASLHTLGHLPATAHGRASRRAPAGQWSPGPPTAGAAGERGPGHTETDPSASCLRGTELWCLGHRTSGFLPKSESVRVWPRSQGAPARGIPPGGAACGVGVGEEQVGPRCPAGGGAWLPSPDSLCWGWGACRASGVADDVSRAPLWSFSKAARSASARSGRWAHSRWPCWLFKRRRERALRRADTERPRWLRSRFSSCGPAGGDPSAPRTVQAPGWGLLRAGVQGAGGKAGGKP